MFKVGDTVRLLAGRKVNKHPQMSIGVEVATSLMIRRTAAFQFVGDPDERYYKQKEFEVVEPVENKPIISPWDSMSGDEQKLFMRKIAGYLFRDKTGFIKINNLLETK